MDYLEALNNQLFLAINGPAGSSAWLVECAKIAGDNLIYVIPALLVGLWLQGGSDRRGLALRAFAVAMLGVGLNQIIGLVWQHPRPFMGGARRLSLAVLACALAVAWARVFLGVHFPMDMAGAALVSLASWALIAPVWSKAGTWATRLAESAYRRSFAWPISAGWIKR